MEAVCYNKRIPIFTCEIEKNQIIKLKEILDKDHFPIILQKNYTVQSMNKWLQSRMISEKRDGLKEARMAFPDFECYHNMFSMSDQYWFQYNKKETWDNLNYFTNDYSQEIGSIFFTPWAVKKENIRENPDLTTNGVLKKQWIKKDGKNYLIKSGNIRYHQSPLAEVLSSMTLKKIHLLPYVEYTLCIHGLTMCCMCENFIDENTEYVPASHIYYLEPRGEDESVYDHLVKMCNQFGITDARKNIDKMIAADHFICNTDRHLGNFGFIRDVETGKLTGFAPLFDCGSSFFNTDKKNNAERLCNEMYEAGCIKKALKSLNGELIMPDDLLHLVSIYPNITEGECVRIKKSITKIYNEFEKARKKMDENRQNEVRQKEKELENDLLFN